jgi:hypothetical protein
MVNTVEAPQGALGQTETVEQAQHVDGWRWWHEGSHNLARNGGLDEAAQPQIRFRIDHADPICGKPLI